MDQETASSHLTATSDVTATFPPATALVIITVALAAAGVVWWVWRHGRSNGASELEPTEDWLRVRDLSRGDGPAAEQARRLIQGVEPLWGWTLDKALAGRDLGDFRALLHALSEVDDSRIREHSPRTGERFNGTSMRAADELTPDGEDDWEVLEVVAVGYDLGRTCLIPAEVLCQTSDWRLLLAATGPVRDHIVENQDEYISDDELDRRAWRASLGFDSPEQLREVFSEEPLQEWCEQLLALFAAHYGADDPRCPRASVEPGEPFQETKMLWEEGAVYGQPRVAQVVARGGIPQQGLATPTGYALLQAIVTITWD